MFEMVTVLRVLVMNLSRKLLIPIFILIGREKK